MLSQRAGSQERPAGWGALPPLLTGRSSIHLRSRAGRVAGLDFKCQVYEFLVTAWAMRCSDDSPRLASEASIRIESLLNGGEKLWTLL